MEPSAAGSGPTATRSDTWRQQPAQQPAGYSAAASQAPARPSESSQPSPGPPPRADAGSTTGSTGSSQGSTNFASPVRHLEQQTLNPATPMGGQAVALHCKPRNWVSLQPALPAICDACSLRDQRWARTVYGVQAAKLPQEQASSPPQLAGAGGDQAAPDEVCAS